MCGSSTTVQNSTPPKTAEELEADRLVLGELRRQNDLALELFPLQRQQIEQQGLLLQYQIDNLPNLTALQNQALELQRIELQRAIGAEARAAGMDEAQFNLLNSQLELTRQQVESNASLLGPQRDLMLLQLATGREELDGRRAINEDERTRLAALRAVITPEDEATRALENFQREGRFGAAQERLLQIQIEAAERGGRPTPEQLDAINRATAASQQQGESDINRYLQQTLRTINEETAQAAGLRSTDTPVVRLSERAGEEAARQQGQLTAGLAQTRAQAELDYPLAAGNLANQTASQASSIANAGLNFGAQLSQRAAENRLRLGQAPQGIPTSFSTPSFGAPNTGGSPNLSFMNPVNLSGSNVGGLGLSFGGSLANDRYRNSTQTTEGPADLRGIGSLIGGIGSAASVFL